MERPVTLAVACLMAALTGGVAGSAIVVGNGMLQGLSGTESVAGVIFAFMASFMLFGAVCLAAAALLALPFHMLLTRLGWTSALAYAMAGAVPGLVLLVNRARPESGTTTYGLLLFGFLDVVMGIAVALGFWRVARPDRLIASENPAQP